MRYQEYEPPIELAPWVKLFWVFECQSTDSNFETIVADGFPELIVHYRSSFSEVERDGQIIVQPSAVACGQLTRPLVLKSSLDAGMIGIRFQPSGMASFVSAPMRCLTDVRVPAGELFVDLDQLSDEIGRASNDAARVAACVRYLRQLLSADNQNVSIRRAVERIAHVNGDITVESLATLTGRSRRSLELSFQKEVGTSPKMYCRIVRFRHLYDRVSDDGPRSSWVQTAFDSGFFDQSHLIRDFRRFAGDTPTSFLTDTTPFAHSVNQN